MEERKNFGLNKKVTPGNINIEKIVEAMRKQAKERFFNETSTGETPVQLRYRKGNEESAGSSFRWKTTVQCAAPVDALSPESKHFDADNATQWGEAVPLFDDVNEPAVGPGQDFDEIIYSKLAKLNETQNTTKKKAEGETRKVHNFLADRGNIFYRFLNVAFRVILIGLCGVILYSIYNANT